MRKLLFLCFILISISMFSQTLLEKVAISSQMYGSLDPNQLKLTILDAINLTNEKDVIAAYLTKIEKDFVWIVITFRYEYVISITEPRIISKKPLETAVFAYSVGLRDAISLTVMSIGKNILFALYQPEGWLVGNDKSLAVVSMKTPAILRIDQSPALFKQIQQEILRKQQGGGGSK